MGFVEARHKEESLSKSNKQKERHDKSARLRSFHTGQSVMARNFGHGDSWIPGVIARQLGPVTYLADLSHGRLWKRHVDHFEGADVQWPLCNGN